MSHRAEVMSRGHDPKLRAMKERYEREDFVNARATDLFEHYGQVGATWAACVQAVKTDYVPTFQNKWGDRLRALKQK